MPPKPKSVDEGIIKGLYMLRGAPKGDGPVVRLIGSRPNHDSSLRCGRKVEEFV